MIAVLVVDGPDDHGDHSGGRYSLRGALAVAGVRRDGYASATSPMMRAIELRGVLFGRGSEVLTAVWSRAVMGFGALYEWQNGGGALKRVIFVAVMLLMASVVSAQPVSKWTSRIYNVGAQQPLSPPVDLVVGANVTCGIDPSTVAATPTNPLKMVWDDPVVAGKACVYSDPGTGPLLSVPFGGNFEATLTATNSAGTSAESARAPFTRPGVPPSAPTGLRLGK